MSFKSKSIATKLLILSCLSAVVIVVSIVAFIKLSIIPQLTDKALENQTRSLAYALKEVYEKTTAQTNANPTFSYSEWLEAFSNSGANVVTVFALKNGVYERIATTLKNVDGKQAVGTTLDPVSRTARTLHAGQAYSGQTTLFNKRHMATYLPVSSAKGGQGAVFIGIDYGSADPMLALARQMDYMVIGVGLVAILLLGTGFSYSIRVERNHREIEDIMHTMQEGLFLLDHELRMGSQTSQALSRILGFDVKAGDDFLELLRPSVSPKTFETAKEYIDLLLRHDVKEKLVASLNPLDCIEVTHPHPNGYIESRFLQIRFNRVMKNGKVTHLLVTANDITRQVKLERELRESERRVQDQMSMMVHILQADPIALQDFLNTAVQTLNEINEQLRTSNNTAGMSQGQVAHLMRSSHRLKGDASALQLQAVTQSLHTLENLLRELQEIPVRKGEALLPVTVQIKTLYAEISAIQEVMARIGKIRGVLSVDPPRPHDGHNAALQKTWLRQWNRFAQQLAGKYEKKVEVSYQGLDISQLDGALRDTLNSIINQLLRNAIVHGLEPPSVRSHHKKTELGHISIYIADQQDGSLELSFRDDGSGIDTEKIRTLLVRNGMVTPDAARRLTARELTLWIFESGFSTRDQTSEDAGHGVGLDTIKALVTQQKGRIRIGSTPGEYCHFRITLPLRLSTVPALVLANEVC